MVCALLLGCSSRNFAILKTPDCGYGGATLGPSVVALYPMTLLGRGRTTRVTSWG